MPRRAKVERRPVPPDPKYHSRTVGRFINKLMVCGKKSVAERVFYDCMNLIESQTRHPALETFETALRNATPQIEVKPRRVGGATYQVPVEIKGERKMALAIRWLIRYARARQGHSMAEKLAGELRDAANNVGATIKRRDETHKMAEANKAFSHYRW
ncbi:MAG TPA: 30S ribosomal protein S7 [Chloroflexota bacterium]|nr:30S ribosomal protein S7 [Chloroflexota bacterium]